MIIFIAVQIAAVFREAWAIRNHAALMLLLVLPFQFVSITMGPDGIKT